MNQTQLQALLNELHIAQELIEDSQAEDEAKEVVEKAIENLTSPRYSLLKEWLEDTDLTGLGEVKDGQRLIDFIIEEVNILITFQGV